MGFLHITTFNSEVKKITDFTPFYHFQPQIGVYEGVIGENKYHVHVHHGQQPLNVIEQLQEQNKKK